VRTVVLTGSSGALGRRVGAALAASGHHVVGLDHAVPRRPVPGVDHRTIDLAADALGPSFAGADVLVHLASVLSGTRDDSDAPADVDLARRVLAAAGGAGVDHVVLVSSASVYGAWPDNPVPLTEDAPIRPNPGFAFAESRARIETLAAEHRHRHAHSTVAVLRPTTAVAEGQGSWMARVLDEAEPVQPGDGDPPVQFLHFDDLSAAVALAACRPLDGPYNVAPDGWLAPDAHRALAGTPRIRLPERLVGAWVGARWRLRLAAAPPEALALTMHPWVVANDRLRAEGWEPTWTNEEAYVAGHPAGPWATLSPKRRQELALATAGAALVGLGVAAGFAVRRLQRR